MRSRTKGVLLLAAIILVAFGSLATEALAAGTGQITGKVTNSAGTGLQDVYVEVYDAGGSYVGDGYADANGDYWIAGLATGSYRLYFEDDSGDYASEYYNNKATLATADPVAVTEGQTTAGINAALAQFGGWITGKVTNSAGTGLEDVYVEVYDAGGSYVGDSYTDANGDYRIVGLATGSHRLFFEDYNDAYLSEYYNDKATLAAADPVAVAEGQTTAGINAVLARSGWISGRVTNSSGESIPGVDVIAYDANGFYVSGAVTDANGDYTVAGMTTGSYRLYFEEENGDYVSEYYNDKATLGAADPIAVTAGQTTQGIDAVLTAWGRISGKVTNSSAAAIANIEVNAYDASGTLVGTARTNASGDYTIGPLGDGNYRVRFYDDTGWYLGEYYNDKTALATADPVAVTEGQTTAGINAVLARSGWISGTVTNSSGAGLGSITVMAYDAGGSLVRSATTDSNGGYTVAGLATGSYRIRFDDAAGAYAGEYYNDKSTLATANVVTATTGQTTSGINAVLATAGHISGTVTNGSGAGLSFVTVTAYDAGGSPFRSASTNSSGGYDVGGLAAGSYRIRFSSASYATEFYNDKASLATADALAVSVGQTRSGIDAVLGPLANRSKNVVIIGGRSIWSGGTLPVTGPAGELGDFTFTEMLPTAVSAASLAPYDTAVLNVASSAMQGTTATLTVQQKQDLVAFVGAGKKLIIYDSECPTVDYSWLPYPFVTANPGQMGATGTLTIVEDNTLSSRDRNGPYYIDAAHLSTETDAVGDMNVMTTKDPHWSIDMDGTNAIPATGAVHTYADYIGTGGTGLIIYDGLDQDYQGDTGDPWMRKIWYLELAQVFNPSNLPGSVRVVGISLSPVSGVKTVGQSHTVTATVTDTKGVPQAGVTVTFSVVTGPNAGASGTYAPADHKTGADGKVSFTYTGLGGAGTDEIRAGFVNGAGQTITSQGVIVQWQGADTTPPTTTDNSDGRVHRSFLLRLSPSDAPSGVATTEYRVNGGEWQTGTSLSMRMRIRHKRAGYRGTYLIEYRSTDNAGNVESIKSCTVKIG